MFDDPALIYRSPLATFAAPSETRDVAVLADCTDRIHPARGRAFRTSVPDYKDKSYISHAASFFLCGFDHRQSGGPLRQRNVSWKSIQLAGHDTAARTGNNAASISFSRICCSAPRKVCCRLQEPILSFSLKICPVCVRISCTPIIHLRRYLR